MLDHPDTAEVVYNTLPIPDAPDPTTQEADMDEATTARAAELQQRQHEIGLQLRDGSITDADEWQRRQHEMLEIKRLRMQLETLLSDEEWHHRAANAASTRSERLVDILADLVAQRWTDFPYRIDWPHRLEQMVEAYRAAGRRGRDLLDDVLAASVAADKNMALIMLTAHWLNSEENVTDDRHHHQALQPVPAGEAAERVSSPIIGEGRAPAGLQAVRQRVPEEKAALVAQDRRAAPVPALPVAAGQVEIPSPQPPTGPPDPAVQSLPR